MSILLKILNLNIFLIIFLFIFMLNECMALSYRHCKDLKMDLKFEKKLDKNIKLKRLTSSDAEDLFTLTDKNRDYLRKWLPWLDNCKTEQDSLSFIKNTNQEANEKKSLTLGIYKNSKIIGIIGFHEIDWKTKSTDIGYWLDEKHQGKGIMTKACEQMLLIGFCNYHLHKITISCSIENIKSQAIPSRLGFKKDKLIRNKEWLYDHYVDHFLYIMEAKHYFYSQKN